MSTEPYNDYADKDKRILAALLPYARQTPRKGLTEVKVDYATRNTSVCFLMLPEWSVAMAPYNVARLVGLTRNAGYKTHAFDLNVAAFQDSKNWGLDYDPWYDPYMFKWTHADAYQGEIKNNLDPLIMKYVDKVVELNPTVVGFSVYECNKMAVTTMAQELKKRLPNLMIMIGGPSANRSNTFFDFHVDYLVAGEGEELLLHVLGEIESGVRHKDTQFLSQAIDQRISLDELPLPDYSDFDFNQYKFPNGVTMEFSRGCIVKCTFCDETHFWKYRDRQAMRVLDEVRGLYDRGINNFWFLDSLVNGNLKELRGFAKGVIASEMKINWTGWARCDGRMDLDFYKDLAAAGCTNFGYGVESGSNKVLRDMDKGITNDEIERNFRDSKTVGMTGTVMLIFGFPTEEPIDFLHTMTLLWRIRNYNVSFVASGLGCFVAEDNLLGQNRPKYNISPVQYLGTWITNDFKNSKIHRLIRIKTFNIFLNNFVLEDNVPLTVRKLESHYKINFKSTTLANDYNYEDIDFNICKPNISAFADSVVNEVWASLYIMYKTRGAFETEIIFDPEMDTKEFSSSLGDNFSAKIKFSIDENGNWESDCDYAFQQPERPWEYHNIHPKKETNSYKRIIMLSDPTREPVLTWNEQGAISNEFNDTQDLSFKYHYIGNGKWD